MTPDEQQECDRLCKAVIREKDPKKLTELVAALNDFLERAGSNATTPTTDGDVKLTT